MFIKIGEAISEDRLVGDGSPDKNTLTPAEATKEINKMMGDKNSPLYDDSHPEHKDYVKRKKELFQMVHG